METRLQAMSILQEGNAPAESERTLEENEKLKKDDAALQSQLEQKKHGISSGEANIPPQQNTNNGEKKSNKRKQNKHKNTELQRQVQ